MDSTNLRDYRIGVKSGPFFMPAFRTDFKDSHMKKYKILLTISNRGDSEIFICPGGGLEVDFKYTLK